MVLKVLLGIGIAVAGTIVAVNVIDAIQKKQHKEETIKDKIEEAAVKQVEKILKFVSDPKNIQTIEGITAVVGFALPVLELVLDIKQFRTQNRMEKQLDTVSRQVDYCYKNMPPTAEEKKETDMLISILDSIADDYQKTGGKGKKVVMREF